MSENSEKTESEDFCMKNRKVERILYQNNAIISDSHLVLTSGNHSSGYINCRTLAGKCEDFETVCREISDTILDHLRILYGDSTDKINDAIANMLLVGPETLGRELVHGVANQFHDYIDYVWCEPEGKDKMVWNSKMDFANRVSGRKCYIIDDVLTTAKTLKQVIELVQDNDGSVEGVVVLVRRNQSITTEVLGVPWLETIYDVEINNYEPDNCPLCQRQVPMLLHPGHGWDWINHHPDYPIAENN